MPGGTLIGRAFVRIDADTAPAKKALLALGSLGTTGGLLALGGTIAPITGAVLSLASSFAVAGGAATAFGAAVIPQFQAISKASQKQTSAEEAQTKSTLAVKEAQRLAKEGGFQYGQQVKITADMSAEARARAEEYNSALQASQTSTKAAAKSQAIYKEAMAAMPPASRDTAIALDHLKDATKTWSDSLAANTMPIFTRGIEFLQGLLPKLTPIVKDTAREITGFVNSLGEGTAGKVFREFGSNVTKNGAGSLRTLLNITRNVMVGVIGLFNAFMPAAKGVSGGLEELTAKFARWSAGLSKSKGFQDFLDNMRSQGPGIMKTLGNIAEAALTIVQAMGPLAGISLQIAKAFAALLAALPDKMLQLLAQSIIVVNVGMKLYALYTSLATAATWAFSSAGGASRASMLALRIGVAAMWVQMRLMSIWTAITTAATYAWSTAIASTGVGAIVIAIGLLIAGIIYLATQTQFFQKAWKATWSGITTAFRATVDFIKKYWQIMLAALGGPVGLLALLIIKKWDSIRDGAGKAIGAVIDFFRKLPGRVTGAVGDLGKLLVKKGGDLLTGLWNGAKTVYNTVSSWLRSRPAAFVNALGAVTRTLQSKGRDLLTGLFNGARAVYNTVASWVRSRPGAIRDALGSVVRTLQQKGRDFFSGLLSGARDRFLDIASWVRGRPGAISSALGRVTGTLFSKGRDVISGLLSGFKDKWSDAIGWIKGIKDKVVNAIKSAFGIHSPARVMIPLGVHIMAGLMKGLLSSGGVLKSAVRGIFGSVTDVFKNGGALLGDLIGDIGSSIGLGTSGGVNRFKTIVALALRMLGQPIGLMGTVLRRMNQESGGNPRIVNKWDSNWQRGTPSVGLMQVIGPTFRAYAGKYRNKGPFLYGVSVDPLANIYASMRYAISRYGSLSAAYNRPGGYARGTTGATSGWHWVGELGAELMKLPAGTQIKSHRDSVRSASGAGAALVIQRLVLENHGVIGSRHEVENWLVTTFDQLRRQNRIKVTD